MKKILPWLYIFSGLADLTFTLYGVNLTSSGMEINPVAHNILLNHGFVGLSIFKLVGTGFVLALCRVLAHKEWNKPWAKHLDTPILLLGSAVSLIGAWSWMCVF